MPLSPPLRVPYGRFIPTVTDALIKHLTDGVPMKYAAPASGVSDMTVSRWMKRGNKALEAEQQGQVLDDTERAYAVFALNVENARSQSIANRVKDVVTAGSKGNWQASAWYLERQLPQDFGKTERHEVTGQEGGPIQIGQAEVITEAQRIVQESMKELPEGSDE